MIENKLYNGKQVTIPSVYRKKFNIEKDDIIQWKENEKGELVVSFRKKVKPSDVRGIGKTKEVTNAVKLKRGLYK